jgi:hypothetical protein
MSESTELYVSPDGTRRSFGDRLRETRRLDEALAMVEPGQTIRLASGVYTEPFVIRAKEGSPQQPITLRGESGVTLDGRRNLVRTPQGEQLTREHYAFVKILDSRGIRLENLAIQNVWPVAVYIENSEDLVLQQLNLHGGTHAILARGPRTRRILVERCAWTGDVSIWNEVDWKDIHTTPHPRRELDGDFFRSFDIAGDVVIRRNMIQHVFNGVHLFASKEGAAREDVNRNLWVYRNTFAFIRDNVVEAERYAWNWWVFGNRIWNAHKWIAFEDATGGHWYIFANVGWFDRKPGPPGDEHTGGAVFKDNSKPPTAPVYVFHNTWYLRSSDIKGGRLARFEHFNNVIVYARAGDHALGLVDDEKPMFGAKFLAKWQPADAKFDHDFCQHPHYLLVARPNGGAPVGGDLAGPLFADRAEHQFLPADGSPLLNAGRRWTIHLPSGQEWTIPEGRHLGAVKEPDDQNQDVAFTPADLGYPRGADPMPPAWAPETV